jgi:hypothetical protein
MDTNPTIYLGGGPFKAKAFCSVWTDPTQEVALVVFELETLKETRSKVPSLHHHVVPLCVTNQSFIDSHAADKWLILCL